MGYQDEVLAIRQQRAARDIAEAQEVVRERYQVAELERNKAAAIGDAENYDAWDRECEQLEDEWQQVAPPPPPQAPQVSAETQKFVNKHQAFFRQPGAVQASKAAHALAVQSGLKVDSPDYFRFCSDALELYGKDYNGTRFDPSETIPHANDVVAMSGLTADQYNAQWRRMHAEGRDSGSQQRQQFGRKVG